MKIHRSVGDEQVAVFSIRQVRFYRISAMFFFFVYAERHYALSAVRTFIQQRSAICLFDVFLFNLCHHMVVNDDSNTLDRNTELS